MNLNLNLNSKGIVNYLLLPVSLVFYLASKIRYLLYICHLLPSFHSKIPVIVVGNITVGGNGKTPVVIALIKHLSAQGIKVGVISRGYGRASSGHVMVSDTTKASECGDEPLLIHLQTGVPMSVSSSKVEAIKALEDEVDIIISDDGLQHYKMHRDIEIAMYNGVGNGWYLPAGPLREGKSRLLRVDLVLGLENITIHPLHIVHALTGKMLTFSEFNHTYSDAHIHAMCGIANPHRFFNTLATLSIPYTPHHFPDHYAFSIEDFESMLRTDKDAVILTTAKDWVKYKEFGMDRIYYLEVEAHISDEKHTILATLLSQLITHYEPS